MFFLGDVLLREEPYAAVLESVFRVNHCSNCLRKTSTPIPCFQCATVSMELFDMKRNLQHHFLADRDMLDLWQVQYCAESCREESWSKFHSVECGILAYLEPSRCLGRLPHLALR